MAVAVWGGGGAGGLGTAAVVLPVRCGGERVCLGAVWRRCAGASALLFLPRSGGARRARCRRSWAGFSWPRPGDSWAT
eukprot:5336151-Pyramimonas_sp.AAC.1